MGQGCNETPPLLLLFEQHLLLQSGRRSMPTFLFIFFPSHFVSVSPCPTGRCPPLPLARRPNRGHIGGGGGLDPLLRYMPKMFLSRVGSALPPSSTVPTYKSPGRAMGPQDSTGVSARSHLTRVTTQLLPVCVVVLQSFPEEQPPTSSWFSAPLSRRVR